MNNTSQSAFARLLATENIRVVHRKDAETASFDIVKRVLTLPIWTNMNKSLYDMLIGHEVAHALWTPTEIDEERGCLKACSDIDPENPMGVMGILNIVEDARIERLIKDKYPGIKRDFVAGYRWLFDSGIFPIEEMGGVSNASLPDRLNLHFKLGILGILNIPFSDEERTFVDRMETSQSWEEVVEIARDLYEHHQSTAQPDMEVGEGDETVPGEPSSDKIFTQDAIDEAFAKMVQSPKGYRPPDGICSMPIPNLDSIIVDIDKMEDMFVEYAKNIGPDRMDSVLQNIGNSRAESRARFDAWVNSETKTINYIVKQFEMKKAADAHKRTLITKSGRLDTVKMIDYKWSEDIFAKNMIVRDGKNHGFIFYLDWSGSMQNALMQTVKQTVLLALFCHKAGIPMELCAFSDRGPNGHFMYCDEKVTKSMGMWERVEKLDELEQLPCSYLQLLRFIRAGMNRRDLMDALALLWYCAEGESYRWGVDNFHCIIPPQLQLASTPLEECLTAAHVHVPQFQQRHGVQVMNVVVLTDGEGNGGNYGTQIYNPINKVTYGAHPDHQSDDYRSIRPSTHLIRSLRETTGANVIGMHLHTGKHPKSAHGWFPREDDPEIYYYHENEKKDRATQALKDHNRNWKKNNFVIATGPSACTYTEAYIINANIEPDDDLDIDDTNHAKMRSSFVKGMAQRSMSRILTNRFVERVAC